MAHARKQLRDAFAAAVTGLTTTAGRVHSDRPWELATDKLPALFVHSPASQAERAAMGGPLARLYSVTVSVIASASSGVYDVLDQSALEIENAVRGDAALAALCRSLQFESDEPSLEPSGDAKVARLDITFSALVVTGADPETIL